MKAVNAGLATRAILFTDMVGSAEHRSRLGEEKADHLRRLHDELIGAAVTKHGGTVLRWTGDGVKASFPKCSGALTSALAMLCSVRAYARRSDAIAGFADGRTTALPYSFPRLPVAAPMPPIRR